MDTVIRGPMRDRVVARFLRWIVVPLVLLALLWYVYPTRYAYYGDYRSGLVRVHRVTQEAHLLTRDGWQKLERNPFARVWEQDAPAPATP